MIIEEESLILQIQKGILARLQHPPCILMGLIDSEEKRGQEKDSNSNFDHFYQPIWATKQETTTSCG